MLPLVAALTAIAITHWLGGVTAFGSSLLAFPVLIWFLDIETTRTVLLLVGAVQTYQVFAFNYRSVDWRQLGRMVFFVCLGLPAGVLAVEYLPRTPLLLFLGCVLVVSGLSKVGGPRVERRCPATFLNGLLVFGGVVHGAFVSGGALVVVYAQRTFAEKDSFRGTLSAFWSVVNTVLVVVLLVGEHPIREDASILAAAIPVTLLATWLGNRTARRLNQRRLEQLVSGLLIVAGVVTIVRVF